jgi:hypothetical protein
MVLEISGKSMHECGRPSNILGLCTGSPKFETRSVFARCSFLALHLIRAFHLILRQHAAQMKYWEIIADRFSKAGWTWGRSSQIDSRDRVLFAADGYRSEGKRFRRGRRITSRKNVGSNAAMTRLRQHTQT